MAIRTDFGSPAQIGGIHSRALGIGCGLLLLGLLTPLRAQTAVPAGTPAQQHGAARHPRPRHKKPAPAAPVPIVPSTPAAPVLPANQPAAPAKITYSPGSLEINADNSSLVATLNGVAQRTGVAIEGLGRDERIYGQYGPGSVASTLRRLLEGSGYDYVLVGGGAERPPTKLLLTQAGAAAASAGESPPAVVPQQTPTATGNGAGYAPANPSEAVQPKTPQQIFEELRKMHPPQ